MKKLALVLGLILFPASVMAARTSSQGGGGGGSYINNQSTLQSGATAYPQLLRAEQIGVSTAPVAAEKQHSYMTDNATLNRLSLDSGNVFWSADLWKIYTQWSGSGFGLRSSIRLAGTATSSTRIEVSDSNGVTTHTFGLEDGTFNPGRPQTGADDAQGSSINFQSTLGATAFTVAGSTVIPRGVGSLKSDGAWLYRINAATTPATVTLEPTDVSALINGRLHRICKTDGSTNTVTVNGEVTLSYVNECVDYYNLSLHGSSGGSWRAIGILKSTSTPSGSGGSGTSYWVGTATSDLNASNYGLFNVSTNSWTTTLLAGVTYYWQGFPAESDAKTYLFTVTQGTVTATEAVTDGVRTGGVAGSTTTMTSRLDLAETRLAVGSSPTGSASVSGEVSYDTTDGVMALTDATTNFAIAYATRTYSVTIASTTGAGTGGWDSLTWSVFNTPVSVPIYIRSVWADIDGGTNVVYQLDWRNFGSLGSAGTSIFSGNQTVTTSGLKTTVISNPLVPPGSHIVFKTSTSASSGTVGQITLHINYSEVIR